MRSELGAGCGVRAGGRSGQGEPYPEVAVGRHVSLWVHRVGRPMGAPVNDSRECNSHERTNDILFIYIVIYKCTRILFFTTSPRPNKQTNRKKVPNATLTHPNKYILTIVERVI